MTPTYEKLLTLCKAMRINVVYITPNCGFDIPAEGQYNLDRAHIIMRHKGDTATLAHEVGHALGYKSKCSVMASMLNSGASFSKITDYKLLTEEITASLTGAKLVGKFDKAMRSSYQHSLSSYIKSFLKHNADQAPLLKLQASLIKQCVATRLAYAAALLESVR